MRARLARLLYVIAVWIDDTAGGARCSTPGCHYPATHMIRAGKPLVAERPSDRAWCLKHVLWQ